MKQKKKGKIELSALAQELTRLAGCMADGRVEVGGNVFDLETNGYWKIEKNVKKDRVIIKIEIKVPIRVSGEDGHKNNLKKDEEKVIKANRRPFKPKKIKKEMGSVWKLIKRNIKQGVIPDDSDVAALWRTKEEYQAFVDDVWAKDWDECIRQTKEVLAAAEQGDFDRAILIAEEVDRLKSRCHKKYK